jgi:hypothetical protein
MPPFTGWRPIFIPRRASRITRDVLSSVPEGCRLTRGDAKRKAFPFYHKHQLDTFVWTLWDSINGKTHRGRLMIGFFFVAV